MEDEFDSMDPNYESNQIIDWLMGQAYPNNYGAVDGMNTMDSSMDNFHGLN